MKPILVMKIPNLYTRDMFERISSSINLSTKKDYHCIVVPTVGLDVTVEVFYEKDFNHVNYEELMNIVTESIKETKL